MGLVLVIPVSDCDLANELFVFDMEKGVAVSWKSCINKILRQVIRSSGAIVRSPVETSSGKNGGQVYLEEHRTLMRTIQEFH